MRDSLTPAARHSATARPRVLYAFLVLQFACQAALVAPLGPARLGFRVAAFASSLVLFIFLPPGGRRHPALPLAYAVICLPILGLLHPALNTPLAGVAHVLLTAAIWSPIIWATRVRMTGSSFRTVMLLLWGYNSLSAVVGVLQAYDPERFAPDPEFVKQMLGAGAEGLKIELDDGTTIWRPMGLTDSPGGAAVSGQFAVLTGLALVVGERGKLVRLGGIMSALAGMFCIYLCQIRTMVVLTGLGIVLFIFLKTMTGRIGQAATIAATAAGVVVGGFVWATTLGEEVVTKRLESLVEDRADEIYYSNRGIFLEDTLNRVSEFPMGAGLGRYGMMHTYFGDPANPASPPVWVEIQVTVWLYDGGLLLLVAGFAAVGAVCWVAVRAALTTDDPRLAEYAIVVAALNLGSVAATFTYPVFLSAGGMLILTLNAALYAATRDDPAGAATP